MIITTPVAKEALRAQVLRLLPNVAPHYEEMIRKHVEARVSTCAWLKRNRTYARALAQEEDDMWSYIHIYRKWQDRRTAEYETLLVACDNAVDVVHLDFETLRRVFG